MRVTLTGATGLIGGRLVGALRARGDEVTVLARDAARARRELDVEAVTWDVLDGPAPTEALAGRDAIVHLAGAPVAQRWSDDAREAIRATRDEGTRNLVAGIRASDPRPPLLVSASASGYYGSRGDERLTEESAPGDDFLAQVCVAWEREALAVQDDGMRVAIIRTGVVLDTGGGALATMLPPFKFGVGGPVAGGRQRLPWIHADDLVALYLRALDDPSWSGAYNAAAPDVPTNAQFSKALGRALRRPAFLPVPGLAIRALYGRMATIVIEGQRMEPARALEAGFEFAHPDLDEALRDTLASR